MINSSDLNIRHLFAAVSIAQLGSISRVAEVIHISQPALTHAVNKLEAQLGHKIFERQNSGVNVTPQGELFLSHVRDGLSRLTMAAQQLRHSAKLKPLTTPELHITNTQLRAFLAVLRTGLHAGGAVVAIFPTFHLSRRAGAAILHRGSPVHGLGRCDARAGAGAAFR